MKFWDAIKINGKATLTQNDYVFFDEEGYLVTDKGVKQYLVEDYFKDENWEPFNEDSVFNLADKEIVNYTTYGIDRVCNFFWEKDVKNCRDLIIQDTAELMKSSDFLNCDIKTFENLVNNRFGDL